MLETSAVLTYFKQYLLGINSSSLNRDAAPHDLPVVVSDSHVAYYRTYLGERQ
jgi:hypothetical protein